MFSPNEVEDVVKDVSTSTLQKLIDVQAICADSWQDFFVGYLHTADLHIRSRHSSSHVKAEWRKRRAAVERASVIIGALLTHAMYEVGRDAAAVLRDEFKDVYARGVLDELRDFNPEHPEL